MQQYAGIYLPQNYPKCLGRTFHPSTGVYKTVPEAAVTILCTLDDGCDGHPKHVE